MSVLPLDRENFDAAVSRYPVLVVEFAGAADLGALDGLADEHGDLACGRVAPEAERELGAMFGLPPGPGLVIFREQIVLYCEPGAHSAARVAALLAQIRDLDMDRVRTAIEEEKRAAVALQMRRVCPTARRGRPPEG